jgi:predicted DNA-binding transcriptional regulator AlpA
MSAERETAEEPQERLTYTVPEAGRKAGLSRDSSYNAAKRGEMPTVKIGGRLLVPKKAWDAILNGEAA